MNRAENLYTIPLQTLEKGVFEAEWKVGKEFIEDQKIEGVWEADLIVDIHFVKQSDIHLLSMKMCGNVVVECDRCLEKFPLPISMEQELVVEVDNKNNELSDAENVMVIAPEDTEICLSQCIYEMIMLSIPLQKVHKNLEDCNADMLSFLNNSARKNDKEKTDSRWDSLKRIHIKK